MQLLMLARVQIKSLQIATYTDRFKNVWVYESLWFCFVGPFLVHKRDVEM